METKYDLNAPAFGDGAQKIEEPTVETVVEPVVEPKEPIEPSEEESKVPYSRFKKFHDRALEAERIAEEWRVKAEAKSETPETPSEELPSFWVENYGDNEASHKAWKNQLKLNEQIKEEARREALDAVRNERSQEAERAEKNVAVIDGQFEALSEFVGRELTEKEQSAVLDIVDDYTPKDESGNYFGKTIPFEKAWEIYDLKQQAAKAPRTQSRDAVAALSGNKTQGEPSISEQDKNFNPLDWNAWKKRI